MVNSSGCPVKTTMEQRRPKRGMLGGIKALPCQACGVGWMKRKTVSSGNALGLCIALLMIAACLGPRAQEILKPFLARATTAYLFSPTEAHAEHLAERQEHRVTPLNTGNRPGLHRPTAAELARPRRPRRAGDHYTPTSYARAITRACELAGVAHWHPHQLRHAFVTRAEREVGLYEAQVAAGHASANVTAATYVHRDLSVAKAVAAKIG